MALESCSCSLSGNTGLPNCESVESVAKKVWFVPYFKSDGTVNEIDVENDTLDQAFFDGKIEDLDANQRWYPSPEIKNIVDERGDNIEESFDDGTSIIVQEGARTFNGVIANQSPRYLKNLRSLRCLAMGAYVIDSEGKIIGNGKDATKLKPIRINEDTLYFGLMKATDTTVPKVSVSFTWDSLENDADLAVITTDNISVDALAQKGLLSANLTTVSVSTTQLVVKLTTDYGSHGNLEPILSQLQTDFALYNVTDDPTKTTDIITSFTDDGGGQYTFTYAAQDSSDVLELNHVDKIEGGIDYLPIEDVTITIP